VNREYTVNSQESIEASTHSLNNPMDINVDVHTSSYKSNHNK